MLFIKTTTVTSVEALTAEDAQTIYGKLSEGKTETQLFTEEAISFDDSKTVQTEIKRLESEMRAKMNGSYLLEEEVKDEEGEITTPAVYFKVTTETALKESMSSDLLDTDTLVTDVRMWSGGNPDEAPLWADYLKTFNE